MRKHEEHPFEESYAFCFFGGCVVGWFYEASCGDYVAFLSGISGYVDL